MLSTSQNRYRVSSRALKTARTRAPSFWCQLNRAPAPAKRARPQNSPDFSGSLFGLAGSSSAFAPCAGGRTSRFLVVHLLPLRESGRELLRVKLLRGTLAQPTE